VIAVYVNGSRSGSWDPEAMAALIDEAMRYVGEKQPYDYKPSADDAAKIRGHIRAIEHAIATKDAEEVKARVHLLVESMLG
jgi:hypothetical protein